MDIEYVRKKYYEYQNKKQTKLPSFNIVETSKYSPFGFKSIQKNYTIILLNLKSIEVFLTTIIILLIGVYSMNLLIFMME